MNELTCKKAQDMLLNASMHGGDIDLDVLDHLQHCRECRDYAHVCNMLASKEPPAEMVERTRIHCHTLLAAPRRRHKAARIRKWSICAGIAALFAILLSIAVIDNHVNSHKDFYAFSDDHFDGIFDETELSLTAEESASINLELDLFASEIY